MATDATTRIGRKVSGVFGATSSGLGTFGALHDVCHYTCQVVVAGLGLVGITLAGLPLAFLEDPKFILLFGAMGLVSLGVSIAMHIRTKRAASGATGLRRLFDRRAALLLAFLLLSGWSVTQGLTRLIQPATAEEGPTRTSTEGRAEVSLTLLNLTDPSLKDAVVFELTMNSMDMSAPSFETLDLRQAITLETDGGLSVRPTEVRVSEWGHMGHHVRGRLVFPRSLSGPARGAVRVVIRGIGGVESRVLEWRRP